MPKSLLTVHASMTPSRLKKLTGRDIDRRDRLHGYSKCGYHFVIDREGNVTEHRKPFESSIHDSEADARFAVSVCLIGGSDDRNAPEDNFTLAQWDSLKTLVRAVGEIHREIKSIQSRTLAVSSEKIWKVIWRPEE